MDKIKTVLKPEEIVDLFKDRECVYFVTIKPPRDISRLKEVHSLCYKYLDKKDCAFWIVPSISDTNYDHFHGIISAPPDCQDTEKFKKAFQRKVNRDIGFNHPLQRVQNIKATIFYIARQRSKLYDFSNNISVDVL